MWFWAPSSSQFSPENQQSFASLVLGSQSSTLTLLFTSRTFLLPKELQQMCSGEANSLCKGTKLKSSWDLEVPCEPPPASQDGWRHCCGLTPGGFRALTPPRAAQTGSGGVQSTGLRFGFPREGIFWCFEVLPVRHRVSKEREELQPAQEAPALSRSF